MVYKSFQIYVIKTHILIPIKQNIRIVAGRIRGFILNKMTSFQCQMHEKDVTLMRKKISF